MPFDSMPTKPDVFSLEGLIAWLETQDPVTEYRWSDPKTCLLGQYFAAHGGYVDCQNGRAEYRVGNRLFYPGTDENIELAEVAYFNAPYTFGAALDRARALQQGRA